MSFHFGDLTAIHILWTLIFAASLVLLVVLVGRDRARRFPWFTCGIILALLEMLLNRMLFGRIDQIQLASILLPLSNLILFINFFVLIEIARRAFHGISRRFWILGTLATIALASIALAAWKPWPSWDSISLSTYINKLQFLQFTAEKGNMLVNLLTLVVGLLVVLLGRRFHAPWKSHTFQIATGLFITSAAKLAVQGAWQAITLHAIPQSQAEYEHLLNLHRKLINAGSTLELLVLLLWIAYLWRDEPSTLAPQA